MTSPKRGDTETNWFALDVTIAPEAREAVEYGLMEAGALGTETNNADDNDLRVTGYFENTINRELVRGQLADALRIYDLASPSLREMNVREVPNEDWLGEWKKNWRPVEVGRFIIAPPWTDSLPAGQLVIRIEPGMAFGTGTHETTRMCLTAIQKHYEGGSFLDVGTGTGILAIAAAKLFPVASIEACDTDSDTLKIAEENARLNEVADRILFRPGTIDNSTRSADFVCANLIADVINQLLPELLAGTCGRLVLSGILDTQVDGVLDRLHEQGSAGPIEILKDGEWRTLVV
jgi:ribosomal protein L11 methyltransferase